MGYDLRVEGVAGLNPGCEILRCADNQVHRERCRDVESNPACLIQLVTSGHDNEKVHIAVGVQRAVRMRAEENDLVRVETLSDTPPEAPNFRKRDGSGTAPAWLRGSQDSAAFSGHVTILAWQGAKLEDVIRPVTHVLLSWGSEDPRD